MYDMMGQRFGRLTVVEFAEKRGRLFYWKCRCDCGNETAVYGGTLRQGRQVSCGCYNAEKRTSHGLSRSREYRAWAQMLQRCNNPKSPRFKHYGARGVKVDPAWKDFDAFIADMGPSNGLTLDRIDNSGNYEPGNCRWATYGVQNNNYRRNHNLTFGGETLTLTEWSHRLNITPSALYYRLTGGWSIERALTTRKKE